MKVRDYKPKRKQDHIEPCARRIHVEKVRFNDDERAFINEARGNIPRAVYIRMMSTCNEPIIPPEFNKGIWITLATAVANLNQLSRRVNSGESVLAEEIRNELESFRAALIGAKI